jgi:hypothetical protein
MMLGTEAVPFPYRVSRTELEVFDIYAFALEDYVEWRLRLAYTDDEGAGTWSSTTMGSRFKQRRLEAQTPCLGKTCTSGTTAPGSTLLSLANPRPTTSSREWGRKGLPRTTLPTPGQVRLLADAEAA